MKTTIRLIAFLLLSAPFSFTAWAQRARAPQNDEALNIELALETPEGYKPVSLEQMEAFLMELFFDNTHFTMPTIVHWEVVSAEHNGMASYGLRADFSDGTSTMTKLSKTSEGKLVLHPYGETTRCYFKVYQPSNAQQYQEGCCVPILSQGEVVCGTTKDCSDCQKTSIASGDLYKRKPFR